MPIIKASNDILKSTKDRKRSPEIPWPEIVSIHIFETFTENAMNPCHTVKVGDLRT
jgi:hypothetical protein